MPPKSLVDDLPDGSSSSKEEEEVENAEEEEDHVEDVEEEDHVKQEEEEEDDEEEQEEESDPDSAGGSDSSPEKPTSSESNRRSRFRIRPITPKPKKPMENSTSSTATISTATPKKSSIAAKRPLEANNAEKVSKRSKKKVFDAEEEGDKPEESGKKSIEDSKKPFRRVWSVEDEVVILKGMIDYIKKGHDPNTNTDGFLDFIKKSLHLDAHRDQLKDKIRRLRNKYENYANREKKGEDLNFSNPHELRLYEISKKLWGLKESNIKAARANGVECDSASVSEKRRKNPKVNNSSALPKPRDLNVSENPQVTLNAEEGNRSLNICLNESLRFYKDSTMLLPGLGENLLKEGLSLIGGSKLKALEQKWRKLQVSEIKVYLKRVELVREQTMLALDALTSLES